MDEPDTLDSLPQDFVINVDTQKPKPKKYKKKKETVDVKDSEPIESTLATVDEDPEVMRSKIKALVCNNPNLVQAQLPPEIQALDKMSPDQLKAKLEAIQYAHDYTSTADISGKVLDFVTAGIDKVFKCEGKYSERVSHDQLLRESFNQVLSSEFVVYLTAKAKCGILMASNLISAIVESRMAKPIQPPKITTREYEDIKDVGSNSGSD